ncbi:hypothetical protein RIF29_27209 [Crotalaria pallida]|uniref:Uncharacterized protein n=1 Tax=Crotalaria pallida TaxID=3830 RepID=A0AAN9ETK0_CROPI
MLNNQILGSCDHELKSLQHKNLLKRVWVGVYTPQTRKPPSGSFWQDARLGGAYAETNRLLVCFGDNNSFKTCLRCVLKFDVIREKE